MKTNIVTHWNGICTEWIENNLCSVVCKRFGPFCHSEIQYDFPNEPWETILTSQNSLCAADIIADKTHDANRFTTNRHYHTYTEQRHTHTYTNNQGSLFLMKDVPVGLVYNNDVQGKEMYFGEIKQTWNMKRTRVMFPLHRWCCEHSLI